jgi:hypothetical protein
MRENTACLGYDLAFADNEKLPRGRVPIGFLQVVRYQIKLAIGTVCVLDPMQIRACIGVCARDQLGRKKKTSAARKPAWPHIAGNSSAGQRPASSDG